MTPVQLSDRLQQLYRDAFSLAPHLDVRILLPPVPAAAAASVEPSAHDISPALDSYHMNRGYGNLVSVYLGGQGTNEDAVFNALAQRRSALRLPALLRPQLSPCSELHLCPVGGITAAPASSCDAAATPNSSRSVWGNYRHVVLGGTFDRLHPGHKLLLSMAAALTSERCVVGVTHPDMLRRKNGYEFMQDVNVRCAIVESFLHSVRPGLCVQTCVISDPQGPAAVDSQLEAIIVSDETRSGADAINSSRAAACPALSTLDVFSVSLVQPDTAKHSDSDSTPTSNAPSPKVSSTHLRMNNFSVFFHERRFCDLFRPRIQPGDWGRVTDASSPYIIGLTGGIACGKSSVRAEMQRLGAAVVDCDALGHAAYAVGSPTLARVVEEFGDSVGSTATGINRAALGAVVFADAGARERLSAIVWPAIRQLLKKELLRLGEDGVKVVVVEAAVLLEAGWDDECDEVWAVHAPQDVARQRLMARNSLTEEQAQQRLQSQMPAAERLSRSHVIINSDQTKADTAASVAIVHDSLQQRLSSVGWDDASEFSQLRLQWLQACQWFDVPQEIARRWWRRLLLMYTGSSRHYHSLHHIRELCEQAHAHRALFSNFHSTIFVAVFHDAVYDATAAHGDNELKSMQMWRQFAGECGWDSSRPDVVADVAATILATANHLKSNLTGDAALFLDLDLEVLSRPPAEFDVYCEQIRMEYAFVPLPTYLEKRAQFLASMAVAPQLYKTAAFERLEAAARSNCRNESARLLQLLGQSQNRF